MASRRNSTSAMMHKSVHAKLKRIVKIGQYGTITNAIGVMADRELERLTRNAEPQTAHTSTAAA